MVLTSGGRIASGLNSVRGIVRRRFQISRLYPYNLFQKHRVRCAIPNRYGVITRLFSNRFDLNGVSRVVILAAFRFGEEVFFLLGIGGTKISFVPPAVSKTGEHGTNFDGVSTPISSSIGVSAARHM